MDLLAVAHLALFLLLVALLGRLVLDWLQQLARAWRPSGVVLLLAEGVYTVTDPLVAATRRLIPPVRFGGIALDLAFLALLLGVSLLLSVVERLAF